MLKKEVHNTTNTAVESDAALARKGCGFEIILPTVENTTTTIATRYEDKE